LQTSKRLAPEAKPSRGVADCADDDRQAKPYGKRSDAPIEQQAWCVRDDVAAPERHERAAPEAMRDLNLRENDERKDDRARYPRADERVEAIQTKERGQPDGNPTVEANQRRRADERAHP
jgi:hypothetical protein